MEKMYFTLFLKWDEDQWTEVTRRKISVQQKEKLSNNLGFIKLK